MIALTELRKAISYNFITGRFTWKIKTGKVKSGDTAGCLSARDNRRVIRIAGTNYLASRLAWLYITGKAPIDDVDHINGDSSIDTFINLRDVPRALNNTNRQLHKNNVSGVHGVRWDKQNNKWQAQININGSKKHLGFYLDVNEAIAARKEAEKLTSDYHNNHGRKS